MILRPAGLVLALALGAPLCAASAATAPTPPVVSLAVTAGTLGIGPEIGVRGRTIGIRGNGTFFSIDHHFHSSDLDYDGSAKLSSAGAMIDLYPFGGGIRLSVGGRYNNNRARVVAMPNQPTSVGGLVFTPQQIGTLSGRGTVRRVAPAATLGYTGKARKGFVLGIEAGALFQGRVRISELVSSTGMIPQARLDAERRDLQDDVGRYHVYPIVQLSLGYRF